ncbi:MAG: LysR family transcriptional regulator [Exilibacterium sp.]
MRFTFRQLEVFLAAAHHENITRAAQSLSMSQSAASSALQDLERQFDIQLFDRVAKRLQLNEFGRLVRSQADALLTRAREFEHLLEKHTDPGELKVGATLSIGNYLAVGIMARYREKEPHAKVALEVANTQAIAAKVANYELDVGLIEGELQHSELEVIPWRDDEMVVFAAPSHPLAAKKSVDDNDLLGATWILREQGSGTRQNFDRAMHGLLPQLNVLLELQHTEAIKRAVEAGMGIGCLSRITLEVAFKRRTLVPLKVAERDFKRHFYFILQRHKYRSAGIEKWLRLCRQCTPVEKLLGPRDQ